MPWIPVGEPMVGPPGTIDIASVTPLAAGATPTAVVTGAPSARKLELGIPIAPGGLTPEQQAIFTAQGNQLATLQAAFDALVLDTAISKSDGALSAAVRPTWTTIIRVGPSRPTTTIQAAVTAAHSGPGASNVTGASWMGLYSRGRRLVDNRTAILLDPGTYNLTDNLTLSDGVDLIGMGATRDDVVIRTTNARYNLQTFGSNYVKNLTLWHDQGATGNNYAYHSSNVTGMSWFTNIFDNVHFRDTNSGSNGVIGGDMQNGQYMLFYRCRISTTRTTGNVLVLHDMPLNTNGMRIIFLECDVDARINFQVAATNPPQTLKAQVWVKDCKTTAGATVADSYTVDGTAQGTVPNVPLASDAIIADERSRYVPKTAAGTVVKPTTTETAVTTKANRVYYYPLGPMPFSAYMGGLRINVVAAQSWVGVGLLLERPNATTGEFDGKPTDVLFTGGRDVYTPGVQAFTLSGQYNVLGFHTGVRFWLAASTRGTGQVTGSTALAGQSTCFYQDTANGGVPSSLAALTPVPSGEAMPMAYMVTA